MVLYTNVVYDGENNQRLATATINIGQNADGVYIKNVENDHIYFIGDGTYYVAFETATGNLGDEAESSDHIYEWGRYGGNAAYSLSKLLKLVNNDGLSQGAAVANGAIGLLKLDMSDQKNPQVATDENGKLVLYQPLVKTVLSGDEIERPDLIKLDGKYYLFTVGRLTRATDTDLLYETNSNIGDNVAMLGFVSDKVDGGFVPLNGDGLVLGASVPATWLTDTYSYYVVKINPANIKNDKVTVNGVTYDKDYFANHVVLVNAYMSNRSETVGKGLNATLGPSFLILIDGNKTTVLAQSTTDQGVWDWNENSSKPELVAASLKEAKRSTDSFSYQVNKDGHWYLYTDNTSVVASRCKPASNTLLIKTRRFATPQLPVICFMGCKKLLVNGITLTSILVQEQVIKLITMVIGISSARRMDID